jgi:two-component system cell cycle sensor histidine kinase/response regulator CckA
MNKLKQWSIGKLVLLTFGTLCVILLVIGVLFFFSLRFIERNNQAQFRAMNKLAEIDDAGQDVERMQAAVLRQLMASDSGEIKRLDQTAREIWNTNVNDLNDYRQFVDTEKEKQLYDRTMQARKAYWEQTQPVLALGLANRDAEATELIISKQSPAYDEYLTAVNGLTDQVETEADKTARATTRLISEIKIIGDALIGLAMLVAIGTAFAVAGIGRRLKQDNQVLQIEIKERKQAEDELNWKTAFLEAQVNSSIDGILVVDGHGKQILQNRRFTDLLKIPQHIADDKDDGKQVRWVTGMTKNPGQFVEKVTYLYSHPDEISRDEVEFKDGTVLDRYSAPVVGKDGKYYGRIWTFRDITERKRTEESLLLLGSAVDQTKESVVITDAELDLPGPKIIFVNPAFTKMTGYNEADVIGKTPRILQGLRTDRDVLNRLRENLGQGKVFEGETVNYRKDGTEFHLEWQIAPLRDASGKITHFVAIQHDITERKQLEAKLFQSQKLETVGKLAGGFAHEFNSILTAIIGQSELLLDDLPAGSPLSKNTTEIIKAANRAATLTRQLLAYGRKQILQPEILDLNAILTGMESTLRHLMGHNTDVRIVPPIKLKAVKADAGQMEQVVMNMVVNAGDAMPNGGKLMLETANVSFDEESVGRYPELKPGDYVMLAITDTGTGMNAEVKARVFEPFFTTKGVGQGTGLGLSTCYGIIKQSGGHISVYSEPGRGTTFKIYLPQFEPPAKVPARRLDSPDLPRGTETILLVEDDPALREMAATLLQRLGYTVLTAADGIEALNRRQERSTGHVDLLFTDVVMPHMSGKELADRVRALYPHTKILFTSAYTENAIVHQGVLNPGVALLQKPFTPSALANKLRAVLDQPVASKPNEA